MARVARALPWWAAAGAETCGFCLQSYHHEVEARCTACDRPLCPHCVVRTAVVELRCPECVDAMDEAGQATAIAGEAG
jgi:hypothetical protein